MSILSIILNAINKLGGKDKDLNAENVSAHLSIDIASNIAEPSVKSKMSFGIPFDSSVVTDDVKADIGKNIKRLRRIKPEHFDQVYEATLHAVMVGGDRRALSIALKNICGFTLQVAGGITNSLCDKANTMTVRAIQQRLGVTHAIWMHAGAAPCAVNTKHPTAAEVRRNTAHIEADGKQYKISEGMFLDGKWTWPGYENGCKCVSKSIIPTPDND